MERICILNVQVLAVDKGNISIFFCKWGICMGKFSILSLHNLHCSKPGSLGTEPTFCKIFEDINLFCMIGCAIEQTRII